MEGGAINKNECRGMENLGIGDNMFKVTVIREGLSRGRYLNRDLNEERSHPDMKTEV